MHGSIEVPLPAAALQPAHAEAVGTLALLHLAKHRFHQGTAPAIDRAPPLGAQFALHALPRCHGLRFASARRWRVTQGGALLVVLLRGDERALLVVLLRGDERALLVVLLRGDERALLVVLLRGDERALLVVLLRGDEQFARRGFGRQVRLRPIAGIGHRRAEPDVLPQDRRNVGLRLIEHGRQLPHVVGLDGHVRRQDDLLTRHRHLGVVALLPAAPGPHDAAVGISGVGHRRGIEHGIGGLRPRLRRPLACSSASRAAIFACWWAAALSAWRCSFAWHCRSRASRAAAQLSFLGNLSPGWRSSCASAASASASMRRICSARLVALRLASRAALARTLVPSSATTPRRISPTSRHRSSTARNTLCIRSTWR